MAARSMPPVRPSDISVAICPILSGPIIVITALKAARIKAVTINPMEERIYSVILGTTELIPFLFLFDFILLTSVQFD